MEQPKVSVVIPVYGVEKYIERCARSLFEQTMQEGIEYVFIDDCSPDRSIEILEEVLKEYPHREPQVKIIRHSENQGSGGTRKTGVENATGEYIIHCDSDDWVEPNMYLLLYQKAVDANADIVVCDYYTNKEDKQTRIKQCVSTNRSEFINQIIRGDIHNSVWNKLINRCIYAKIPIWTIGLDYWEDVSVLSRMAYYAQNIAYISQSLYHYWQGNTNAYTHKWDKKHTHNILDCIAINEEFFKNKEFDTFPIRVRGFYSILYHTCKEERSVYLKLFRDNFSEKSIDYSLFSVYGKICAWALFHNYHFVADSLIKIKRVINRV